MRTIEKRNIRVTRSNAEVFHDYVKAHLWMGKPLEAGAVRIDCPKDFSSILNICEMILDKKEFGLIEKEFKKMNESVKKSFPLTIFNKSGKLRA